MFEHVVRSEAELRSLFKEPSATAQRKQQSALDHNCRAFIGASPLAFLATADAHGRCDVSPKGGPAGFVQVLDDHHLAIPDLPGNNRIDSLGNLVQNPNIGLLFVIPGLGETLRVQGQGYIVRDPDVLERCTVARRTPPIAIGVVVEEAFLHCAKAFRRGQVWEPEAWPDRDAIPSPACMLRDHMAVPGLTAELVAQHLEESYATRMW